ncbi:MAG TPA: chloride channel protein [Candidatus Baltobacteraceae bacterium]|nr:chloride channel protein [Candidatus Baltobacteraceae bacterium]
MNSFHKTVNVKPPEDRPAIYHLAYWKAQLANQEGRFFLVLTIVIGALAGLAVVAFILLTERLGARIYPPGVSVWRRLLGPIAGALTMGFVLARFFPDARGNGIVQTKSALYSPDARMTMHSIIGKFFCTSVTLASGIPLGPEGPSVAVGAGIASVLGRALGLKTERVRTLIPVGAAAAIAAAFNTPIAAVLFSLEEIVGDLHAPVLGSVVLASATAWMVLRLMLGDNPLFHVPQYQLASPIEFAFYAVLGIVGGIVSGAFLQTLLWIRLQFKKFPASTKWIQPLAGGVLVGVAGIFAPQVLGVGYVYINALLNGHMAIKIAALLVVLKLITSATSAGSGNAGGIFAPVLFIGAMMGGAVGGVAHHFWPQVTASPGAYALVGMGAAFAGIIRTPMTSVVLVFEVTRDYTIIVPLMIANLVSYFISRKIQHDTLYEDLAAQDGIHLPVAGARVRPDARVVGQVMHGAEEELAASKTVDEANALAGQSMMTAWPVCDEFGLVGLVSAETLKRLKTEGKGALPLAEAIEAGTFPHVHSDQALETALERMGASGLRVLPVVSRFNVREMLGVVYLTDILNAYRVAIQASEQTPVANADHPAVVQTQAESGTAT